MVTSKFYPPSKPQPYNTVPSARVTMPCTRSSDLIHPVADRLYYALHQILRPYSSCSWQVVPFYQHPPTSPIPHPHHFPPVSVSLTFFFDATNKWLPSNFCPWLVKHIQNLSFGFTMNNLSETVFFFFLNLFLSLILTSCPFQISFQSCSAFLKKLYFKFFPYSSFPLHLSLHYITLAHLQLFILWIRIFLKYNFKYNTLAKRLNNLLISNWCRAMLHTLTFQCCICLSDRR